jgi:membrane-associated protease RseP (regulator of RpoE activity)
VVSADPFGLRVRGVVTGVQTQTQWVPSNGGYFVGDTYVPVFGGSNQTTQTPYQYDETAVVDFRQVTRIEFDYLPNLNREYKWALRIWQKDTNTVEGFRFPTEQNARSFADAMATLAVAAGSTLHTICGLSIEDAQNPAGAKVDEVFAHSPAAEAGLLVNDVVTEVNSTPITGYTQLIDMVQAVKATASWEIKVLRDGNMLTLTLPIVNFNLGRDTILPSGQTTAAPVPAKQPVTLGVQIRALHDGELTVAGLAGGLMITAVITDGLAEKAGVKTNDILVEVNGKPTKDLDQLKAVLSTETPSKIKVVRNGNVLVLDTVVSM